MGSEPSQTSKLKLYAKTVNNFNLLTVIEKISTPDVRPGPECAPEYYYQYVLIFTAQKMKFSIKDFFLRIWSHLLKKFLMENFIFCAVIVIANC